MSEEKRNLELFKLKEKGQTKTGPGSNRETEKAGSLQKRAPSSSQTLSITTIRHATYHLKCFGILDNIFTGIFFQTSFENQNSSLFVSNTIGLLHLAHRCLLFFQRHITVKNASQCPNQMSIFTYKSGKESLATTTIGILSSSSPCVNSVVK